MALRYACLSQRGYYPDDLFKANQDRFLVVRELYNAEWLLLAVFDGHGPDGHDCANFARQSLPSEMIRLLSAKDIRGVSAIDQPGGFERCYRESFVSVNKQMHMQENFDDNDSGTTAIVALIQSSDHGDRSSAPPHAPAFAASCPSAG